MTERIVNVYIEDHVKSRVDPENSYILAPGLQFAKPDGKVSSFMNTRYGTFQTGFLSRVLRYCFERNIETNLVHNPQMRYIDPEHENPLLDGITFRPDQQEAVYAVMVNDRGIIKAPTGTGKTVIMAGVVSCYPSAKWLIISHTSSLVLQTANEFKQFGFHDVGVVGAGTGDLDFQHNITVGTRQTIAKFKASFLKKLKIDGVIIDEAHHVVSMTNEYAHILRNLPDTCLRIGFTATLPTTKEKQLAMEGLLGPVICELSLEKAVELDLLAKPRVILRRLPNNSKHAQIRNWPIAYRECVVENKAYHRQVVIDLYNALNQNLTVLIMITEIRHAENLIQMARNLYNIDLTFVHGGLSAQEKERIRKLFITGEIPCVVATTSWREGINIPTLGVLITAGQGKSELKVLQEIGRGLRKTENKNHVTIYDYFNPNNRNLVAQFAERLCLYMDRKWLAGMED